MLLPFFNIKKLKSFIIKKRNNKIQNITGQFKELNGATFLRITIKTARATRQTIKQRHG